MFFLVNNGPFSGRDGNAVTLRQIKDRTQRVVVGGLVTLFLLGYVVPRFSVIYESTGGDLPYGRQLMFDILNRTETAMSQAHCFMASELALLAESFNQMTAELETNRKEIESGANALKEKNLALEERRNYIETVLESLSTGVVSLDTFVFWHSRGNRRWVVSDLCTN